MPVLSPSRYSSLTSSSLSSSYRPTSLSSPLDKPYYRSSYLTRTSYSTDFRSKYGEDRRERKTSLVSEYSRSSRAASLGDGEVAISSRFASAGRSERTERAERSERSASRGRDTSIARSDSDALVRTPARSSIGGAGASGSGSSSAASIEAELRKQYSPAYYVPLALRNEAAAASADARIARSKSISTELGRPPLDSRASRKARNQTISSTIAERRRPSGSGSDTNGNDVPPSVQEIRKRFDSMSVTRLPTHSHSSPSHAGAPRPLPNGTAARPRDEAAPVPVHLPTDKLANGKCDRRTPEKVTNRLETRKSSSNSDISRELTKSDSLSRVKSQLGTNNPIGKILEKSTVIQTDRGAPTAEGTARKLKVDIEKQTKSDKQTNKNSNIASYIQNSSPVSSKSSTLPSVKDSIHSKTAKNTYHTVYLPHKKSVTYTVDIEIPKPKSNHIAQHSPKITSSEHAPNLSYDHTTGTKKGTTTDYRKDTNKHENTDDATEVSDSKDISVNNKKEGNLEDTAESCKLNGFESSGLDEVDYKSSIVAEKGKDDLNTKDSDESEAKASGDVRGLKYIDSEAEGETECGYENKTFEHEMARAGRGERARGDELPPSAAMETSSDSSTSSGSQEGLRSGGRDREGLDPRPSHSSGLNGLRNIGNTCFMNSVIQCLSNTRPLLEYITLDKYQPDINTSLSPMKGALIKAFATVIKELWREGERDCVVNTTALKSQLQRFAPRFMGYAQQDAQEFLRYLVEGLHEDVNRVTSKPPPILTDIDSSLSENAMALEAWRRYQRLEDSRVGDIFMGQLKSTLRCTHCRHDSVTFDPFWDLSLPIPCRGGTVKLEQCLQHFTKEEELDGDEKPRCEKCGVRRKCLKWFTVQRFPRVLVLHLKRFSGGERFRGKLSVLVQFPATGLDMSPYAASADVHPNPTYNLYAVSNHSGTTYSGHYTAYCRHPYNGQWHEYNDSRVSSMSLSGVVSSEAYVLFYELATNTYTNSHGL